MTNTVTPTAARPTHDVLLKDLAGKEVALVLVDATGKHLDTIQRDPYPTSATKIYSGTQTYADSEPPFTPEVQQDWSGGRGSEVMDSDATRYEDGLRADTSRGGKILLGGLAHYATGYRQSVQFFPGDIEATTMMIFTALYGATQYLACIFAPSVTFSADKADLIIRKIGTPTATLTVSVCSDNSGVPGTVLKTVTIQPGAVTDTLSVQYKFNWSGTQSLTGSTYYWIVIGASGGNAASHWEVLCDTDDYSAGGVKQSVDDSTWLTGSKKPYLRITDADTPFTAHFFEYKGQLYYATEPDDGSAGQVYINGDRGACDSNSGALGTLVDASKSWATNQWSGCIAQALTDIPTEEIQSWREIDSNNATTLNVAPDWNLTHTTQTEYVILGTNYFRKLTTVGGMKPTVPITDVAVAHDIAYFAQGLRGDIIMHREYILGGAWYEQDNGSVLAWQYSRAKARNLCVQRDQIKGSLLWMSYYDLFNKRQFVNYDQVTKDWQEKLLSGAVLDDGFDAWNEDTIANVTSTFTNAVNIAVDGAFTVGLIACEAITSTDIRYSNKVGFRIASTLDHVAGGLQFLMDNSAKCASPLFTLDLPALKANTWQDVLLEYDATDVSGASAIISIGLKLTEDKGSETIQISGPTRIYDAYDPIAIEDIGRINKLLLYGQPATLWCVGEGGLGEIREDVYQPAPIWDIRNARSTANGMAAIAHDVYLNFSFGYNGGVQQYYATNIDDIGPNGDMGLPNDRKGMVSALVGWPGRMYAAIDAGPNGYSSVLVRLGQGWHEVYRAPRVGERIRDLYIQSIPGSDIRRLWISQGSDVLWIPVSQNAEYDSNYYYTYESSVVSGRIYSGMQDVAKFYNSIKLATKHLDTSGIEVRVDYKLDGSTTWVELSDKFTVSPFQQVPISSTYNASGKWIQYRLRLYTSVKTTSPVVHAVVMDIVSRNRIAYAYPLTFRIFDKDKDLNGIPDDEEIGKNKIDQLDTWIAGTTPIIMCSTDSLAHNVWVFPEPVPVRRVSKIQDEAGHEGHVCTCTMLGLATYTP